MSRQVIYSMRKKFDEFKTLSVFQKAELGQVLLQGILAVLTDLENENSILKNRVSELETRLSELEKKNG